MNNRKAFTMVELIMVIVIIGVLSSVAIPKFSGVKDQAKKATELSTAQAISSALESIHSTWSTSDGDFDWNNDGVDDDIDVQLAASGYPLDLTRNNDDIGALIRASGKSGFKKQSATFTFTDNDKRVFQIYTAKASDPVSGVKFASNVAKDIEGKPDKNDFWLYMVDTNSSKKCFVSTSLSKERQIISGDFMLIDVNGSTKTDFTANDLGMAFTIDCS